MALEFYRRGKVVSVEQFAPDTMLLDYLRLTERSRGTKEGCNEGDCGACTVVLGEVVEGRMSYKAVNACILFLGQIHGKELITIEDLAEGGKLHPVQQAMVELHGGVLTIRSNSQHGTVVAFNLPKERVIESDTELAAEVIAA